MFFDASLLEYKINIMWLFLARDAVKWPVSGVSQETWEGRLVVLAITYDETRLCCSIDLHHGQEYLSIRDNAYNNSNSNETTVVP